MTTKKKHDYTPRPRAAKVVHTKIYISGELVTFAEAAERTGLTVDKFTNRRRYLLKTLPAKEALTWDHFTQDK